MSHLQFGLIVVFKNPGPRLGSNPWPQKTPAFFQHPLIFSNILKSLGFVKLFYNFNINKFKFSGENVEDAFLETARRIYQNIQDGRFTIRI